MIKTLISFYDISLLTVIYITICLILLLVLLGLVISMSNPKPFPFTQKEIEERTRCNHAFRATIWERPTRLCAACHGRLGYHHDFCLVCCCDLHKNLSCMRFYKSKL